MKYAFVAGSNGPAGQDRLQFAEKDADRLSFTLGQRRSGYEMLLLERPTNASRVRESFTNAASACSASDTFLVYLSAHGIIESGELVLLWDDTTFSNIAGTGLWASDLLRALDYCQASRKLVILDCCHAGGVVQQHGFKDSAGANLKEVTRTPRECLFLVASDRLQRARELQGMGGSFLAVKLCEALTSAFHSVPKRISKTLCLDDFRDWVRSEARAHNMREPTNRVPEPYIFGRAEQGFDLVSYDTMPPFEFEWPNNTTMVVLPHAPIRNRVLAMSKHPVTNRQYRWFVEATGRDEPIGEVYLETEGCRQWTGPFRPWADDVFGADDMPVVCVTHQDAAAYADFLDNRLPKSKAYLRQSSHCMLPDPTMWVFAALGDMGSLRKEMLDPGAALHEVRCRGFHHMASTPTTIDDTGRRLNRHGLSDMIGNVWEWCTIRVERREAIISDRPEFVESPLHCEVLGGGYLDDVNQISLRIQGRALEKGNETAHADLGFRLAGCYPLDLLPLDVREHLDMCVQIKILEDSFSKDFLYR